MPEQTGLPKQDPELVVLDHSGQPRIIEGPQEPDPFLYDFLQKKGLIDPQLIERTKTIPRMKGGKPDNIKGKRTVRPYNFSEEMDKDIGSWLVAKGLKEAPEPPKQPVPPELQAAIDKVFSKKNLYDFNPIKEVLPPAEGEKYPRIVFNSPPLKERGKLDQLGDVIKAGLKHKGVAVPPEFQTAVQAYVDAIPRLLSAGYVPSWTSLVMDAVYPGASEEFAKTTREHLTSELGYEPKKGIAIAEDFGYYAGLTPVFRGLSAAGGAVAPSITSIPILQSLIRGTIMGAPMGALTKPEGKDTFLKRIKQVPASVAFFTVLDVGALALNQVFQILKWNKNYSGFAFSGGGKKTGYGPGVKIEAPGGAGGEFTREDIQALYNKMKAKAAGQKVPEFTDMDRFILSFWKGSPGWQNAINNGWVKAFERKPGMGDIFRKPQPFIQEPGIAMSQAPGLPPGPPTEAAPSPEPGPSVPRPIAPAATTGAAPGAKPGPQAKTALGLPKAPMGRRAGGEENTEARRVIDSTIVAFKEESYVDEADLEQARLLLESDNFPSVGNEKLQGIQERLGAFKYWAVIDAGDKADIMAAAEIGDRLLTYNDQDNPIEWPASIMDDGTFVIGDNDPDDIQITIDRLNKDLESGEVPIKVTAGYGTSIEEAEENLIKSKTRARPVPPPVGTLVPEPAGEPIYHWTQPENIEKIFEQGFNTKLPALFTWGVVPGPKGVKGYAPSSKPEKGVLYFTRDPERYATADVFVGQGKGDKDYRYYNKEKKQHMVVPLAMRTTPLKSIEAFIQPGSRILVLDSLQKYLDFKGGGRFKDSLREVIRKAKRSGEWDGVEIKHVAGQWEKPGYSDRSGNKDLFHFTIGAGGQDDFFIFNRKAIKIPEQIKHRVKKLFKARWEASLKRGLVGWPKGKVALWDNIFEITNGTGIKPYISPTTGIISKEFSQNVPRFMWNKKSTYGYDLVQEELAEKYGYNFDNESLFTLLQKAEQDQAFGQGGKLEEAPERTEEEMARSLEAQMLPILNPGETLEQFFDRMAKEAQESGWGDDVNGYIDQQLELKKAPEPVQGGPEDIPDFKLTEAQKQEAFNAGYTVHDLGDHPLDTIPDFILDRMKALWNEELPQYVSYNIGHPFDDLMQKDINKWIKEAIPKGIWENDTADKVKDQLNKVVWKSRVDYFLAENYMWADEAEPTRAELQGDAITAEIEREINTVRNQVELSLKNEDEGSLGEKAPKREYKLGEEQEVKMEVTADIRFLLNASTRNMYGTDQTGNKLIQEVIQNDVDAAIRAFIKRLIEKGQIDVAFRDGLFYATDNGEGMDEDGIKNFFLRVYGSGKRDEPSIGSFGIGSALVVAVHDKAVFSLDTQNAHIDTAIVNSKKGAKTIPFRQGTKLIVHWPKEALSDKKWYDPLINDRGIYYVLLNSFPSDKIAFTWKNLDEPDGGKVREHEFILDRVRGVPKKAEGDENTKLDVRYYTSNELMKLDKYWTEELGLSEWRKPSRVLDAKTIIRISHPLMPDVKLIQAINTVYSGHEFHGALLVDVTTNIKAGSSDYPLKQSRDRLLEKLQAQIDAIIEPLGADAARAARQAVVSKPVHVMDNNDWKPALIRARSSPSVRKLDDVISSVKLSDGTHIPVLDRENMIVKIDEGYEGDTAVTEEHIRYLMFYDSVLQLVSDSSGVPYGRLYPMLSVTINGTIVQSQRDSATGAIGLNHTLVNLSEHEHPADAAMNHFILAVHELAHHAGRDQTPEHEREMDRIRVASQRRFFDILKIAQEFTGKRIDSKDIDKIVQVDLPAGKASVRKNVAKRLSPEQTQLNLDMKERSGGSDQSIYRRAGKGERLPGYDEGSRRPERGEIPGYPQRPGPGVSPAPRRGAEQPVTPGAPAPYERGVGVQPGGEGGGEPDYKLTKTPGPRLQFPVEPQKEPTEPIPDINQVGREELELKREKAKTTTLLPEVAPSGPKPSLDTIWKEVVRLTTKPNYPRHWVGNTKEEEQDNRTNILLWTAEHYDPKYGPLEHYINYVKQFFYRGRMPSGQHAKETIRSKVEKQIPEATTETGAKPIELPEESSAFAPESAPIKKLPPAPEDAGAKEARWQKEAEKIDKIYQDVAHKAAIIEGQQTLPGLEMADASQLEKQYYEILKSRLERDPELGESYRDLGARLGLSHETVRKIFEDILLPRLKGHPQVREMLDRLEGKMASVADPEKTRTHEAGYIAFPSWQELIDFYNRWLTSTKGQSLIVDRKNDLRIGAQHAALFDMALYADKYNKWADKQPDAVRQHVREAFMGHISGGTGYNDIRTDPNIPPDIKQALLSMRGLFDLGTQRELLLGIPPHFTALTMARNMGKYLERRYRAYEGKYWEPTEAERADLKRELMTTQMGGLFNRPMTAEEADKFIDEKVAFIKSTVRHAGAYEDRRKLIDQDSYLRRNNISPAWRKFLGEYTDLTWLVVDGYARQAARIANAEMMTEIANHYGEWTPQNPDGIWTQDPTVARMHHNAKGEPESWENWRFPDEGKYGILRNKYVPREFYNYMTKDIIPIQSEQERLWQFLITIPYKWIHTIGSVPTWARNVIGNAFMSVIGQKSVFNPLNWKEYWDSLMIHIQKYGSHYQTWSNLIRHGFTETGFYGADIPDSVRNILNPDDPATIIDLFNAILGWPIDKLGQFYNFQDSWFRVAGKLINERRGMSIEENVEDINETYPNYRKNPRIVDFLQKFPVLGPFVSFRVNMIRIALSQARKGYEELKSPDIKTRSRGLWRLTALVGALVGMYIVSEMSKKASNVNREYAKQLEEYLPPWRRNGQFIYYRDKNNRVKMVDMSFANPFGEIGRTGKALLSGDIAGTAEAMNLFSNPIWDVIDIVIKGREPKFGKEYERVWDQAVAAFQFLYLPASSPIPNLKGLLHGHFGPGAIKVGVQGDDVEEYDYLAMDPDTGKPAKYRLNKGEGNLRPGILTGQQIKNLMEAYNNNPTQYGRIRSFDDEMISFFTGIRSSDLDPELVLFNAIQQRKYEILNLNDEYRKWKKKNITAPEWQDLEQQKWRLKKVEKLGKEILEIETLAKKLKDGDFFMEQDKR